MDAAKSKELSMKRLANIYKMDLSEYGIFGMDENTKSQLRRALLSRGLHPSMTKQSKSKRKSGDDGGISIEHNKGILLHGPPGTGKTMLAQSMQHLLMIEGPERVSIVNGPEVEDIYVGQTEKNIRNLFERAKADYKEYGGHSPLHLIILDEMDSIAKKRDSSSNSKVYDRSVQQLLSCLDGASALDNVVMIGTTNRFQDIDGALLRPGRLGVHVFISLPDEHQRLELLTKCGDMAMRDMEMEWLVDLTEGLSHSDIAAVVTQSKVNAVESVIRQWFEADSSDSSHSCLYEKIKTDFKITQKDIVGALDEIRINQVYRERNGKQFGADYAFDIAF